MSATHGKPPYDERAAAMVRECTAALPDVTEEVDGFGHLTFRVGKKPFAIVGGGPPQLSIKSDALTQDMLIRAGRFERTPYIGQHGWVSLRDPSPADLDQVRELVLDAFRLVAPKRLLRTMGES